MALHWGDCLGVIEALIPQAVGGTALDETLRLQLVPFANNVMDEISREQRWSNSFLSSSFTTVAGTQSYDLFGSAIGYQTDVQSMAEIKRLYYVDATGRPHLIDRMDRMELQRVYGDVVGTTNRGSPQHYALDNNTFYLYPIPDSNGPTAGNYAIIFEFYGTLPHIVETTGTTTAASATLTVPSSHYLTVRGLSTVGPTYGDAFRTPLLIVRNAGDLKIGTDRDWHNSASWSAFPSGTTVTMSHVATASVTAQQCFFNASNWLMNYWSQVLVFGTLREVASYWGNEATYQKWEVRYHDQLERMQKYEFDKARGYEVAAVGQVGQRANTLRRIDWNNSTVDVRGGT